MWFLDRSWLSPNDNRAYFYYPLVRIGRFSTFIGDLLWTSTHSAHAPVKVVGMCSPRNTGNLTCDSLAPVSLKLLKRPVVMDVIDTYMHGINIVLLSGRAWELGKAPTTTAHL